jgi:hypothetical protein
MATTASRTAKARPKSAQATVTRPVTTAAGKAKPAATAPVKAAARVSASKPVLKTNATAKAPAPEAATPVKPPSRAERVMASITSVQESQPLEKRKPWPLWRKIALWVVMLMPLYAIIIYIVGAFYFLPFELKGVGINKSFSTHVQSVVGNVSVPDQEGVFLQTGNNPHNSLSMILQYNDRGLQPPLNQQMSLKPTDLRYVLIRQAQVSLPTDYRIYSIDKKGIDSPFATVNQAAQRVKSPGVALISLSMPNNAPWPAGSYVVYVPEAGLDDGMFYCFFTIAP